MNIVTKLRDPTAETSPVRRSRLAPPLSLEGKSVALMDIGKARGSGFIDRLEAQRIALRGDAVHEFGGHDVDAGKAASVEIMKVVQTARCAGASIA
jgi:hypothetical protein